MEDREITSAWQAFPMGLPVKQPKRALILRAVAFYTGVSLMELVSHRRQHRLVQARQLAMYLMKRLTTATYPQIAETMQRDHTTVLHAVRKLDALVAKHDTDLEADIAALTRMIEDMDGGRGA